MKDSFNSDFYITAATVIPLLYITLFLQGQVIQISSLFFMYIVTKDTKFWDASPLTRNLSDASWLTRNHLVRWLATPIVLAIPLTPTAGILAEVSALLALYYHSDYGVRTFILWSMLGLLFLVPVSAGITIMGNIFELMPDAFNGKPDSTKGKEREVDKTSSKAAKSPTGLGWPPSD